MAAATVGRDTLPEHWSYGVCRDGRVFFINDQLRCTTWLHPRTGEPVNSGHMIRSDLPRGWEEGFTEEGASYFIDHNQQTTAFRHPVTGQFSPENSEFILQEEPNPHMSKQDRNQRPSSMVSETSTAGTASTLEAKPGPKIIKSSSKVHSFGKRDQAIRRNPNVPVVVRGWLHKQDSSGMRLWKRRWFVLADYCLFYYKDSREEAVLGSIPLPSYVISPVAPEDRISRKYSFKAVHTGMRALIYNSSTAGSQAEQSGMRTYYFSADTQEDMNAWVRAMNQAAQVLSRSSLKRDMEKVERQAVPQANHTESCHECGRVGPGHTRDCPHRGHDDIVNFERQEQEGEQYRSQRDPLEGKRDRSKARSPYSPAEEDALFMDLPTGPRGQQAQPQRAEKNGMLPASYGPGEQNGTGGYQRAFPPRTNPEKHSQRKSNLAQVEHWARAQKGDSRSLPLDQTLPRQGPGQSLSFPENYQTLPKSTRHPSGGSSPPPRNLPSDYKYAQDRASHLKMSSEERRAHRDGTVWQLYEWQQRQQFRHGSPTAPICLGSPEFTDQGRSRSMLEVPRSISVPPSPSDIPPPGPPRVFPPRRPHTPAERVTVKPPDQRRSVDISLGDSPRRARGHAVKNSSHVDRRSMPSMGYMTHTVSAPSLHGKSADDTYLQLKKDLEYLDLKMTGRDLLKDRSLKPVKIAESDTDVKLSIFCEQDRVLQDLEDKIRALKENKDQLESVLEVLHRQMEQYRDQPQHLEKIAYQQKLLQEDLVHIRAELSRESTEMENAWNEYLKLENDVEQLKQTLQEQHRRAFFFQEKSQIQKDLWRIEDVTAGLSANKENFRILVESVKNPERKTVPLFPHPPVPSLSTSESKPPPQPSPPTSPVRTPLEVRLFPQLQTYVPYRPHPPQLRKVTSPLQSPTKAKPKVEDEAPPRPPLPELYSPEDQPPAVPPLPREATIIRHTSVRGLKRQSDERKRDRELGQCVNGDSRVELRSYVSEPELATLSGDMAQPSLGLVGPESRYQTLPGRGLSGSTSRLQQSSTIAPYVTLRRGLNAESSKATFPRPKSALERLYSGDHQRGKMSAEEQLERMKRHQKALVRERKRTLGQGERTGLPSSRYLSRPLPGDLGSWKREQDFDLQLLERVVQGEKKDKEENGWLKVQAMPVTELDLEPQDYDLDISRELSKPEKVSIPERYVELDPEEPPSLEELQARYRKAEKIRNILARSSMCNLQPTSGQDQNSVADLDLQLQEQERIINISYALASEASQRSKQVAAQAVTDP
ncbi:pleckstrin homology domain containing A7 [Homo sapiens]|uniref:Pleckstrin homology domain-containing family A member 7 n=1 Tax=Homo sapiens TaxID=9606 RepID=E9PKC0_HUMAN|nr:pleckstrin homology domain-containing family A member 7 isoform 1 [Homo sapiens]KAI2558893.1 pleckstrin-likey domain containing A7 [Homo sapiens]KAI4070238.1 pleckstrin homology domain containing A7 [Homo sapiens]|eukprot:NP_001316559.1 pleckstrin homology domain-containing family A member 7 isoform 1 [Homo sapiens]